MSANPVTTAAIADAGAVLDMLAGFAGGIDFTASVAAATSASGAVDLSRVAGLSILQDIATARVNLTQLVAVPANLASTLVTLIQEFQGTGVDFRQISDAAIAAGPQSSTTGAPAITWASEIPAAGLGAAQIAANRAALANLVALQALIEAVRAATSATYASQDDALTLRDDLAGRLDDAMAPLADRSLRASLDSLRATLVIDINSRAAVLAQLVTFTPARILPALVLANRLYDDPTRAADICARNSVAHPGFVPAAPLTVLDS